MFGNDFQNDLSSGPVFSISSAKSFEDSKSGIMQVFLVSSLLNRVANASEYDLV